MAMPREDGDGVGPKGEGALRAPLGEPEAWMFPAHTHTHTHSSDSEVDTHTHSLMYTHAKAGRRGCSLWLAG